MGGEGDHGLHGWAQRKAVPGMQPINAAHCHPLILLSKKKQNQTQDKSKAVLGGAGAWGCHPWQKWGGGARPTKETSHLGGHSIPMISTHTKEKQEGKGISPPPACPWEMQMQTIYLSIHTWFHFFGQVHQNHQPHMAFFERKDGPKPSKSPANDQILPES